ncbi:MAG: cohesin domain-containing protein [Armatimonadota bacterium]
MKVVKKVLGLVALGLLLAVPVFAQTVSVGEYTANPGDTVNVEVKVDDKVTNVAGAQVLLDFSSVTPAGGPALAVTSEADVKYGVIPAGGFIAVNLGVAGQANIGVVAMNGGNGPGTLLTIPIKVPANAVPGAVYALNLVTADLNDPSGNVLSVTKIGGKITIAGAAPPPPPAAGADIQVGTYEAKAGDVVNVEVKVSDKVKNVAGAQVLLKFGNIGAVTAEADVKYGVIPAGGFIAVNLGVAGEANIGIVATSGGNGPGTLLTIPIKLKADLAAGEYPLTLVTADLNDPTGTVLTGLTLGNGAIKVMGVAPPPPPTVAKVEVTAPTTTLKVGETVTLTAKALDATGAEIAGQTFTWASSDSAVATVDATGKVTAVAAGKADITAAVGDVKSAPVTITVEAVAPPPVAGAAITVATDPATPVKPGDVVNILINVNEGAKNVAGAQIVVNFGALGAVTAEADVKYGVIPAGGFIAVNLGTPGEANIGIVATAGGNGPGTLLTIPIKVAADAKAGNYPINITLASLNDPAGTDIPVTVTGGSVTVTEVAPPPVAVPGDLTGDGKLMVDDVQAAILLAFQAQPDPEKVKIVDVNGDGKLSLADLRIMLRRSLGLPDAGA